MINRVLIRIKVVQMLYSYLLTRNDFTLPQIDDNPSRDKAFAFTLYHDLLLFLLKMSGIRPGSRVERNRYIAENRFLKALSLDPAVQIRLNQCVEGFTVLENVVPVIADEVLKGKAYRSYTHTKVRDVETDIRFLETVVDDYIKKSTEFFEAARRINGFTNAGYESAFLMLSRTLRSFCDNRTSYNDARNSLRKSLDKAYELYHSMLLLIVELTDLRARALDVAKHKYLPTAEDLNPNTKFVDNRLAALLMQSEEMADYRKDNAFQWLTTDPGLLERLLGSIMESEIYKDYMASEESSLEEDCEFWRNIMRKVISPSDDLAEVLEGLSVYWNDDLNVMDSFVLKTIKRISTEGKVRLLPKYKDDEDARFGMELFDAAVEHREEYRELIDRFIDRKQWDSERLAFMDIVIMITAITELLKYPAIPVPVTLNEYIEIANCYSTSKSGQFINGILYSVINYLKEEGRLNKI